MWLNYAVTYGMGFEDSITWQYCVNQLLPWSKMLAQIIMHGKQRSCTYTIRLSAVEYDCSKILKCRFNNTSVLLTTFRISVLIFTIFTMFWTRPTEIRNSMHTCMHMKKNYLVKSQLKMPKREIFKLISFYKQL